MWLQKKREQDLINYLRSRYSQVEVKPKKGIFNYKCFHNAVQFAKDAKIRCDVYECIIVYDDEPSLHYINFKNGEYLETTLGYLADKIEYYVLRKIPKSDYMNIEYEFSRSRESWNKQFTSIIDRKIFRIKSIL